MSKRIKYLLLLLALFALALLLIANTLVASGSKDKTFDNSEALKKNKVGLVLGTSKYMKDGRINLYFEYRITAAVELYKKGKVEYLLISGDNSRSSYDEPTDFKEELIKRGVPENRIYLDYAGLRTLDSVVRAKEIFGQTSITVISQRFHNERAIYLAHHFGIKAIGFNAKNVEGKNRIKTELREYLARTKALLDVVFNTSPKFLGNTIKIE